jgi:hypothetical protein
LRLVAEEREGLVNPRICSWEQLNDRDAILCTTGYPFHFDGTVKPLYLRLVWGELELAKVLEDTFAMSQLCWPVPNRCMRLPIDLKLCDDLLRATASDADEEEAIYGEDEPEMGEESELEVPFFRKEGNPMSDMTSLSSNYSATAAFAKEFNGAVLMLKRRYLAQQSVSPPTADDEAEARRLLTEYVDGIIGRLVREVGTTSTERIPEAVIARLAQKNQNKMTWLVADLRQVQRFLGEAKPFSEDDFAALDEVCDAADATASASFRRLWRR